MTTATPALTTLMRRAAVVWLAYSACGGVAVACGVPGQQAAPLYLPAGLALAFLQGWGLWMLLPIALGGFTVDAATLAIVRSADVSSLPWLGAAAACGIGAALQAWVGWRWLTGGRPEGLHLDTPSDIGRFLLIAGVLSCSISAGLSVPALVHFGWIAADQGVTSFVSWWAGDAMGVALGAPLALTLVGRPKGIWRTRRWAVGLPLALSVVLLSAGSRMVGQARAAHEQEAFEQDARTMATSVRLRLQGYLDALEAQHGLFAAGVEVPPTQFDRAAARWQQRLAGVQAFAWTSADQAHPHPLARAAFERARREDKPIASAVFALGAANPAGEAPIGLVFAQPVYRGLPFTPQARVQATRGTVSLTLKLAEASAALLSERPAYMGACLIDVSDAQANWLGGASDCVRQSQVQAHAHTEVLDVAGRRWALRLWNQGPVPAVMTGLNSWVFTLVGVAFAGAWGALLLVMTSHARHLQAARDEAQARRLEAERANRAKSEFMSRMSHELRTPLNAVLGFAQVMEMDPKDPLSPVQKERLAQVQQAGWNLLEMIDDVLDISRLDTGALRLQRQRIPLGQELLTARRLFEPDALRAGVRLHSPERWPADWQVMADGTRLRQILGHLLSNAIKFNAPGGEVWLDARADRHGPHPLLHISVHDSGMGLNAEQLSQLFQPFNRVGREHGPTVGRGVGLAISRHLAQLMGGELQADSASGQGATFTLTLPLCTDDANDAAGAHAKATPATAATAATGSPAPTSATAATPPPTARRRHVLYVEDNATNSDVVRAALTHRPDLTLTVAADIETGLAALHDRVRGSRPALILLDVHLPDASGLEFLGLVKSNPDTAAIPVIMVSADALPEQIDAALAAGAACYLTKPVQLPALLAQMDELLARNA